MEKTTSDQISHIWDTVKNLPETQLAKSKLEKDVFEKAALSFHSCAATVINFEHFTRSMQAIKASLPMPDAQMEKRYVARFEDSIEAYKTFTSSLQTINLVFKKSGFDAVINANAPKLFKNLPMAPIYPRISENLRALGFSEADVSHCLSEMKANKWDLFGLHDAGGTFEGFVKVAVDQISILEKKLSVVKEHGIPVVEGANGWWIGLLAVIGVAAVGATCWLAGLCVLIIAGLAFL